MGGAKRYPSIVVSDADGFRKALDPSYELRTRERAMIQGKVTTHFFSAAKSPPDGPAG